MRPQRILFLIFTHLNFKLLHSLKTSPLTPQLNLRFSKHKRHRIRSAVLNLKSDSNDQLRIILSSDSTSSLSSSLTPTPPPSIINIKSNNLNHLNSDSGSHSTPSTSHSEILQDLLTDRVLNLPTESQSSPSKSSDLIHHFIIPDTYIPPSKTSVGSQNLRQSKSFNALLPPTSQTRTIPRLRESRYPVDQEIPEPKPLESDHKETITSNTLSNLHNPITKSIFIKPSPRFTEPDRESLKPIGVNEDAFFETVSTSQQVDGRSNRLSKLFKLLDEHHPRPNPDQASRMREERVQEILKQNSPSEDKMRSGVYGFPQRDHTIRLPTPRDPKQSFGSTRFDDRENLWNSFPSSHQQEDSENLRFERKLQDQPAASSTTTTPESNPLSSQQEPAEGLNLSGLVKEEDSRVKFDSELEMDKHARYLSDEISILRQWKIKFQRSWKSWKSKLLHQTIPKLTKSEPIQWTQTKWDSIKKWFVWIVHQFIWSPKFKPRTEDEVQIRRHQLELYRDHHHHIRQFKVLEAFEGFNLPMGLSPGKPYDHLEDLIWIGSLISRSKGDQEQMMIKSIYMTTLSKLFKSNQDQVRLRSLFSHFKLASEAQLNWDQSIRSAYQLEARLLQRVGSPESLNHLMNQLDLILHGQIDPARKSRKVEATKRLRPLYDLYILRTQSESISNLNSKLQDKLDSKSLRLIQDALEDFGPIQSHLNNSLRILNLIKLKIIQDLQETKSHALDPGLLNHLNHHRSNVKLLWFLGGLKDVVHQLKHP